MRRKSEKHQLEEILCLIIKFQELRIDKMYDSMEGYYVILMNTCTSNFLQKHDSSGQVEDPYVMKKMKAKFTRNFQQRVIS